MTEDAPRTPDLCPECGTPLEVAEASETSGEKAATALVLRCANGHVRHVTRHAPDDPA